jgi:dipeptidyl aminopeptidase/acylaminoacyl peptidase
MFKKRFLIYAFLLFILPKLGVSQDNLGYQVPPASIMELIDAPTPPKVEFNQEKTWMLIMNAPRYVDMEFAAYPMVGLAGLRINPMTHTLEAELHGFFTSIELVNLTSKGKNERISISGLPNPLRLGNVNWQPDGNGFAFTNRTEKGLEVWYANLNSKTAKKLTNKRLNALSGEWMQWHPSGEYLLVQVPANDGKATPVKDRVPKGPVIQENLGTRTPSRTFSNLLTNAYDEDLFDFYATSQLTKVYVDGRTENFGKSAIFTKNELSPNGEYIIVETIQKPYSYTQAMNSFPKKLEVWGGDGKVVKVLSEPSANRGEMSAGPAAGGMGGFGGGAGMSGPRSYSWRSDKGSVITYVQSINRRQDSIHREAIYELVAPFNGEGAVVYKSKLSLGRVFWGNDQYAIVTESDRASRKQILSLINPTKGETIKVIDERSTEDTYSNPGTFITKNGVLQISGKKSPILHSISNGASPVGEVPFLLEWDLMKGTKDTLFKSSANHYEMPVYYDGTNQLYFTRENWNVPANMIYRDMKKKQETALTQFESPYPSLAGVEKTLIKYTRKDGVQLTGTMYLPANFTPKNDEPLPVVVWAYPREYKTKEAASQVKGSSHKFTELNFRSAVYWVTRGYAVVDQADMPIIGEGDVEPNDGFVEQLIWNSEALIDHMVDAGIADRDRFGVGGHSYGAFMTANLLAHSDLFAAGIARSGAYNRTLTPFGFQSESRTFWNAKEVYDKMSPFNYADKIKLPLLITHGIDDENSGTFPVQSERLYAAIKGHGGTVRLVMFPYEFHGFRARESIMHVFWEQDQWLEKYVKNREKKKEEVKSENTTRRRPNQ